MAKKKTREAEPGELRAIRLMELLERLSKRPESRMDLQRMLSGLSGPVQIYAKHLITSGPSGNKVAAKACGLSESDLEKAMADFEAAVEGIWRA